MQEYKEIYNYEQSKDAHEVHKEKLESLSGGLEGKNFGQSTDDSRFRCASLISNRENPQASSSGI